MFGQKAMKTGFVLLAVVLLAATGCTRKETVKSNEGMQGLASARPSQEQKAAPGPGEITTETLKPEAAAPSGPVETGALLTEQQPSPFPDIHFDFDKSAIHNQDKPTLEKVAGYLKAHPGARVLIEGNCDERGTEEYNMMLGDRRAEAAKKYLAELAVPGNELSTISFGKDKPVDPGHNEEAWAKDRNDHFVLQ